ncbi:hypothetical protein Tco_0148596 [Tanacetum coccineum]
MPTTRSGMTADAIEQLIAQLVAEALTSRETNRNNNNGNINENENRNETNDNVGGAVQLTCVCTYKDFHNCKPHNFNGTEGVVGLARCALTWWNSHVKTIGIDAAYEMPWNELIKMMTEVYCPRNEIQKMENEVWNLTV